MSYQSLKANNYYLTVCASGNIDIGSSSNTAVITGGTWSNGVNSGGSITSGFRYNKAVIPSSNLSLDASNTILIPVRGLYCVSCSWNMTNDDSPTSNNPIFVGFTISNGNGAGSTHTPYLQVANPESYSSELKGCWSITQMLELQQNDRIRGTINGVGTNLVVIGLPQTNRDGRGSSFISVALIAPFSG